MENNFDRIERFFSGTMDHDEKAEFEKQKSIDKEFAREIFLYKQANELILSGARTRLKQHLDDLGQKELTNTMIESYTGFSLVKRYWYAIAASVLIIIGLGYFAYFNIHTKKSPPALARLFDIYYEVPKADLVVSRGGNTDEILSPVWNSAIQKYSENQFEDAMDDFRGLLQNSKFSHPSAANFYLGICFLNINMPDSAISCFNNVSPTSSLSQDASWYLGLSYLKAGQLQKGTDIFKNISEMPRHYKKEQAKEILELLSHREIKIH
jgi:hypothetical protein